MSEADHIDPATGPDLRRKRIRFRAWHRGTKEADLILGQFADRYAGEWDTATCDWFERLLEWPDPDIVNWVTGAMSPPSELASPWLERLVNLSASETAE